MLCTVSDICGELDWYADICVPMLLANDALSLLALAQGAQEYKLTRPKVSTENIIDIKGGR